MRLIFFCFLVMIACAFCKSNTKSLTESMGQEVIEIGAPLKDLPGDLEEEPSAEPDEDGPSRVSMAPATKKDVKKLTVSGGRRKMKDVDAIDGVSEDEAKVEKELAELYKDSDYNTESGEVAASVSTARTNATEDPALRNRARSAFKFQPDLNNAKEIERFRTSVDEISCDKSVTKKLDMDGKKTDAASSIVANYFVLMLCATGAFR